MAIDPMAIALTIGLIDWIEKPDYGIGRTSACCCSASSASAS